MSARFARCSYQGGGCQQAVPKVPVCLSMQTDLGLLNLCGYVMMSNNVVTVLK